MPDGLADHVASRRFLTFRVSGRLYALPGEVVEAEMNHVPPSARVPHAARSLMGLANLRGAVIPLVDLRRLLDDGAFVTSGTARAIVFSGLEGGPIGLAVDKVDAFLTLEATRIDAAEPEMAAEGSERLLGTFRRARMS